MGLSSYVFSPFWIIQKYKAFAIYISCQWSPLNTIYPKMNERKVNFSYFCKNLESVEEYFICSVCVCWGVGITQIIQVDRSKVQMFSCSITFYSVSYFYSDTLMFYFIYNVLNSLFCLCFSHTLGFFRLDENSNKSLKMSLQN